jgi:hypothetical protein
MSSNIVHQHGTDHMKIAAAVAAHRAGDLVCEQGYFGTVQDDVAAGDPFTLLLNPTVNFPRVPSTLASGVVVAAPATAQATTLPIGAASPTIGFLATAGWFPFGKTIATGTASTAKIQLIHPNLTRVIMP